MSSRNDCRNSSDPSKASRKSAWIWVLIMAGLLRRFAMWYAKQRSRDLWERMEACMKLASKGSFDASSLASLLRASQTRSSPFGPNVMSGSMPQPFFKLSGMELPRRAVGNAEVLGIELRRAVCNVGASRNPDAWSMINHKTTTSAVGTIAAPANAGISAARWRCTQGTQGPNDPRHVGVGYDS